MVLWIIRLKVIKMIKFMMCQDCLKVMDFDAKGHNEEYFCSCGGQLCGCSSCNDSANLLLNGVRDSSKLGLRIKGKISWTKELGIKS